MTTQTKLQWTGDNNDGWYLRRHRPDGSTDLLAIVARDYWKGGFFGMIGTANRDEDRYAGKTAKALRVKIYSRLMQEETTA